MVSAIVALQKMGLHTETQVSAQAATVQELWLVPLNTKPVKAALDVGTECQNEVKRRGKGHVVGFPTHARGSSVLDKLVKGGNRQAKRSAPELHQAIVEESRHRTDLKRPCFSDACLSMFCRGRNLSSRHLGCRCSTKFLDSPALVVL